MNLIVAEMCPYCTKQKSPKDIIRTSGFTICVDCYQRHNRAVAALSSGKFTDECSECHLSVDELTARQVGGDKGLRMSVIYENGFYKVMCDPCADVYETKRRELFKNTEYAKLKGLT